MPALLVALLTALRSSVRSRLELEAEIFALRHQLAVLQREAAKRARLRRADNVLWVLLSRLWAELATRPPPWCAGIVAGSRSTGRGNHDRDRRAGRR
jgi:hypothetical protein